MNKDNWKFSRSKDFSDPQGCQTKPRLGYAEFFEDCEAREARGEVQLECTRCERYRWPDELCQDAIVGDSNAAG